MKHLATLAIAVLLSVYNVAAQSPPEDSGRPERARFEEVRDYLTLTDSQIESLRELQQAYREAVKPIFEEMAGLRKQLREAMNQDPRDEGRIGQLMSDLADLRQQPAAKREELRDDALGVLDEQQKMKLATLEQAMALMPAARQATHLNLLSGGDHPRRFGKRRHGRVL